MRKKIILLITLTLFQCVFCLSAAEPVGELTSSTYIVYRAAFFPQDRYKTSISPVEFKSFIATGKTSIEAAGGQPIAKTEYTLNYSGKYALWTVSPLAEDESHVAVMLSKGYIIKLAEQHIVRRDTVTEMSTVQLATLPPDFYEVTTSTTTE